MKAVDSIFTLGFNLPARATSGKIYQLYDGLEDLKILVVDDNATSRIILHDMLRQFGCSVSLVSSGEEAISEISRQGKQNGYDLVLMDWNMPGMNGVEDNIQNSGR